MLSEAGAAEGELREARESDVDGGLRGVGESAVAEPQGLEGIAGEERGGDVLGVVEGGEEEVDLEDAFLG